MLKVPFNNSYLFSLIRDDSSDGRPIELIIYFHGNLLYCLPSLLAGTLSTLVPLVWYLCDLDFKI